MNGKTIIKIRFGKRQRWQILFVIGTANLGFFLLCCPRAAADATAIIPGATVGSGLVLGARKRTKIIIGFVVVVIGIVWRVEYGPRRFLPSLLVEHDKSFDGNYFIPREYLPLSWFWWLSPLLLQQ